MNHKKILIILVVVTTIGFWWFSSRDISYKTDNFPLKENWKVFLDFPINHLTLASNEILLVRTNARLYALDTTTGEIVWQYKLSWKPAPEFVIADQGKVFLSDGKEILALNLASGEVIWNIPNPERNVEVNAIGTNIVILQVSQRINVYDANSGSFILSKPACRSSFYPW